MRIINKTAKNILKIGSILLTVLLLLVILFLAKLLDSRTKDGWLKERPDQSENAIILENSESSEATIEQELESSDEVSDESAEEIWYEDYIEESTNGPSAEETSSQIPEEESSQIQEESSEMPEDIDSVVDDSNSQIFPGVSQLPTEEESSEEFRPTGGWGMADWD